MPGGGCLSTLGAAPQIDDQTQRQWLQRPQVGFSQAGQAIGTIQQAVAHAAAARPVAAEVAKVAGPVQRNTSIQLCHRAIFSESRRDGESPLIG